MMSHSNVVYCNTSHTSKHGYSGNYLLFVEIPMARLTEVDLMKKVLL